MLVDEDVRAAAVTVDQSFIIQAPAGSGKTSLLVKRFVNLLKICKNPEECLAITFTKKAAFEMRYRVLQTLEQIIQTNEKSNDIYRLILANPNKLQILTIDAFCANLTRKMPILSKFGVDLKIAEDPEKLYQTAVDRLLATMELPDLQYTNIHSHNSLIKLFEYLANDHELIKKLLIEILVKREQWLPFVVPIRVAQSKVDQQEHSFNLRRILENNLRLAVEDVLADIFNCLPKKDQQNKILFLAKHAANNINDINNNIVYCKNLTNNWPEATCINLSVWRGLAELLLNKDGQPRTTVNLNQGFLAASTIKNSEQKKLANQLKSSMHELLNYLKEHAQVFLSKLQQVNILPDPEYDLESWNILQNLFFLLPELVAHLMLVFEERQEVDFTQIAIAALEAMGTDNNHTDLAIFLDHRLNHILVDEFQDTSVLQFNLLEKLVASWDGMDGRTIFLVGDPMQSIYRFRQANVGLFLRAQQYGIGNIKLKTLYLKTNFRSSKCIIDNLNKTFCKIFPAKNDLIVGGVSYSDTLAPLDQDNLHANKDHIDNGVQFFLTENAILEAENIVQLIKQIKQDNVKLSIAILVRAKSHASLIVKKLREYSIAYQAMDIEPLSNQSVICDLISLTRAVLHVNDIVAWLSILRGPLVGLKLVDLHALHDNVTPGLLLNELQNYNDNEKLSGDAKLRLSYVLPILFNAIEKRESVSLSILIKKTWLALGGNLFLATDDLELAENFFYKLTTIKDIFEIGRIEELMQKYFVSLHTDQINLGNVQVMTIHKAKGLEFDVVIVPGMDKSPKISTDQLFLWEERTCLVNNQLQNNLLNNYLLFAPIKSTIQQPNTIYNFIKLSEQQRELNESKRLLYVAMTRAKKNIYGFACNTTSRSKSFLKFLELYYEPIKYQNNNKLEKNKSMFLESTKSIILHRIPTIWYMENIKNHSILL